METELFTVCDHAQDIASKLVIIGTFDSIWANNAPFNYPKLSIALKIRFSRKEVGNHKLIIKILSPKNEVLSQMEADINISEPNIDYEYTPFQFVANIDNLKFDSFGKYKFELFLDGEWLSGITLHVNKQNQGIKMAA